MHGTPWRRDLIMYDLIKGVSRFTSLHSRRQFISPLRLWNFRGVRLITRMLWLIVASRIMRDHFAGE